MHGMLNSLKTNSGPHAHAGAVAAEPIARAGEARLPPVGAVRTPAPFQKDGEQRRCRCGTVGTTLGVTENWFLLFASPQGLSEKQWRKPFSAASPG